MHEMFDFQSYDIKSCDITNHGINNKGDAIITSYDTIIIGAGPVGLYAGIRMKKKFSNSNVLIIEQRESYSRKEIIMIQNNKY
jgi:ribulose 1,5-bisphosphate synthetase/thiazole synthase